MLGRPTRNTSNNQSNKKQNNRFFSSTTKPQQHSTLGSRVPDQIRTRVLTKSSAHGILSCSINVSSLIQPNPKLSAIAMKNMLLRFGIQADIAELSNIKSMSKWNQIQEFFNCSSILSPWHDKHGTNPTEDDYKLMYEIYRAEEAKLVAPDPTLVNGFKNLHAAIKTNELKLVLHGDLSKESVEKMLYTLEKRYHLKFDDVQTSNNSRSNTSRDLIFTTLMKLATSSKNHLVIGGTPYAIQAGIHAGVWTIGITRKDENNDQEQMKQLLICEGAHYVVDEFNEIPEVLDEINERVRQGETPAAILPSPESARNILVNGYDVAITSEFDEQHQGLRPDWR